jgi:outer membrane protein assembly factor BamB
MRYSRIFFLCLFLFLVVSLRPAAENWPGWRGPTGQGISTETGLPTEWGATSNIAWKTPIPGLGWSSPIVWEDRVFVTTTTDAETVCRVICLDRKTGEVLWDKEVFEQVPRRRERFNSYATPTPVTDGKRVYAVFGDGSIVALNFAGEIEWTNREVKFYSQHGLGASPVLYQDLLIMPFDGSADSGDLRVGWQVPWDKSFILAVDKNNGQERWRAQRGESRIAHVTPNILRAPEGDQLVSGAGDVIQGFNPQTGELIWQVHSRGEGVVPSIVIGDGLIFTMSGYDGDTTIRTVRQGGKGDVTKTHIAWEEKRGVPNRPSFVHVSPHLFAISDGGVATCYEAATGKIIWQERVGGNYSASPIYAEGRIYFLSEQGESTIIKAGPEFEIIARNSIGERCQASYAVSQGQIFIRSENHLFCIGR